MLITSLFAVLASVSKFLDWGVRLLDWVQRFEYIQEHQTGLLALLRWFVSPTGADVVLMIALVAFFIAVILAVNPKNKMTPLRAKAVQGDKPDLEILSPFDNEEVGLYGMVHGRTFPPDQELQVAVFAGGKWYPQRPVSVKGSSWSVKCQFGNPNIPSGGAYKVVALLGNELKGGMWYHELPTDILKSNIISVHRPEVTIEDSLSVALNERDDYKNRLQTATNAFTDMEERVETLTAAKTELERNLSAETRLRESKEDALEIKRQELAEVRANADAQTNTYEMTFKGMSEDLKTAQTEAQTLRADMRGKKQEMKEVQRERDRYKSELAENAKTHRIALTAANLESKNRQEELLAANSGLASQIDALQQKLHDAQHDAKQATLRANQETNQREEFIRLYYDSERKLGDLKWLEGRMRDQAENLDSWVRIKKRIALKLQLSEAPLMVIFVFWVVNTSIFNVALNFDDMTGRLQFKNRAYRDPVRLPPNSSPVEYLDPGDSLEIILEQPLLETEAQTILASLRSRDVNGIFWLGNLKIPMAPTGIPQSFNPKDLSIHSEIEHMNISDFRNTDNA